MNNRYLGMVRQWQTLFYDDRKCGVDLEGSPDFAKLADAFPGAKGLTLRRAGDCAKILERAAAYTDGPCVINAIVEKTDNVFPMIPAGAPLEEMLIKEPSLETKLEKPSGST
jgi:acetolactate synthase-1/2/3 large subunit